MVTSFNMDSTNAKLVIATAEVGVSAYLYEAEEEENDKLKKIKCQESIRFADKVSGALDRIQDELDDGHMDATEAVIAVDLTDTEMLCVLASVRCAFETFISSPRENIYDILCSRGFKPKSCSGIDKLTLARTSHAILDFFECHCSIDVLEEWIENRRTPSERILNEVAMKYETSGKKDELYD